jgi:hypothetical protein
MVPPANVLTNYSHLISEEMFKPGCCEHEMVIGASRCEEPHPQVLVMAHPVTFRTSTLKGRECGSGCGVIS